MTPTEASEIRAAMARNNADWCASVCRSHGMRTTFDERVWCSGHRAPPYYPDAVTLVPDVEPSDFLARIDTASPGCSVKDSFATLDLSPEGFVELFTAEWIYRPTIPPAPRPSSPRIERVSTSAGLRAWARAWRGGDALAEVFRPALLEDPSVLVAAALDDAGELSGGFVLNRSTGVVGLSNLFAAGSDVSAIWSSAVAAATEWFPGLPLVGYEPLVGHERGEALDHAVASGFSPAGTLRVWLRAP